MIDKIELAYKNDDLEKFKELNQGTNKPLFETNEMLKVAAGHGSTKILNEMLTKGRFSEDAIHEALDTAIDSKQVASAIVLVQNGGNLDFAKNGFSDDKVALTELTNTIKTINDNDQKQYKNQSIVQNQKPHLSTEPTQRPKQSKFRNRTQGLSL